MSAEPTENATATASLVVSESDLASSLALSPPDAFPRVFATARMVALMEIASARVLQPYLTTGQLSVGVNVDVTHTAATPLGAEVTATSTYVGRKESYLFLKLWLRMQVGKLEEQAIRGRLWMCRGWKGVR